MKFLKQSAALVLIDIQKGFNDRSWGQRNNPMAEENIKILLHSFRNSNVPIIHIQHLSKQVNPLQANQPGVEFMDCAQPRKGEPIFQKSVNSAFIGTPLESYLNSKKIKSLVLAGFTTDHCVSTTARMGANLGFEIFVVSDATVAFERQGLQSTYSAEMVHQVNLASLNGEFAHILTTQEICLDLMNLGIRAEDREAPSISIETTK